MMKRTLSLAAMVLLLFAGAAAAQQSSSIYEGHLDHLDRDGDGGVSQDEYVDFMADAFKTLDADGDDYLMQTDVSPALSADQFAATDTDGDGRVSRQEFMIRVALDFQAADTTSDGQLR